MGSITIAIESSTNGATTLSRMNLSGYVGHVTIFSWMFTIACCLVVGLGLGLRLGLDLGSGWLVVMHTYLYYFRLSLWHCLRYADTVARRYYLFLYSSWLPQPLRDRVAHPDDCDDILINFVASHVTRRPPIAVVRRPPASGRHGNDDAGGPQASSYLARRYCVGRFAEQFGYMPLVRSAVRFEPLLHRDPVSILRKKYRQMESGGPGLWPPAVVCNIVN